MLDFKIKICGITNSADARHAVDMGADAIGLNFFQRSLRSVTLEQAQSIVASLPSSVNKVGVFVNHTVAEIEEILARVGLDTIQLHGDESLEWMTQLSGRTVIRAVRVSDDQSQAEQAFEQWKNAGAAAILIDSAVPGQYGGTGIAVNWQMIGKFADRFPTILAGGLTPDNVENAIREAHPAAVDVASGVENFPGKKDALAVEAFVTRAKIAFQNQI